MMVNESILFDAARKTLAVPGGEAVDRPNPQRVACVIGVVELLERSIGDEWPGHSENLHAYRTARALGVSEATAHEAFVVVDPHEVQVREQLDAGL